VCRRESVNQPAEEPTRIARCFDLLVGDRKFRVFILGREPKRRQPHVDGSSRIAGAFRTPDA
jgi:hypothetical protein